MARLVMARQGKAGRGKAVKAWLGEVGLGWAGMFLNKFDRSLGGEIDGRRFS